MLGCLLAPVAATLGWVRTVPADTEAFVAAAAPLVHEPAVQDWLTESTASAIEQSLDVESLMDEVFDGLEGAANRRITRATLQALRQPAIDGVRLGIRQATQRIITSPAFATTWEQSLRFSHSQAIAALADDPAALAAITADGVGLRLGPIVARVRQELIDRGYTLAARIPAIDRTIPILSGPDLTRAQGAYRLVLAAAFWVPVAALLLVVGGIAVAVRRHRAALGAAVGLALAGLLLLWLLDASRRPRGRHRAGPRRAAAPAGLGGHGRRATGHGGRAGAVAHRTVPPAAPAPAPDGRLAAPPGIALAEPVEATACRPFDKLRDR
jgi:hypothetical protein